VRFSKADIPSASACGRNRWNPIVATSAGLGRSPPKAGIHGPNGLLTQWAESGLSAVRAGAGKTGRSILVEGWLKSESASREGARGEGDLELGLLSVD
jgi:hypothetical protein